MAIRQHLILSGASLLKVCSFMFWSWLYLWTAAALPDKPPELYSRIVTLLHGSVAAIVGLIQCDFMNITPLRLTSEVTSAQYALMVWSWGYFAMDFMWCMVYWSENLVMLCHHVGALYAVSIYMNKRNAGCTYACNLTLMEITNPLLQTRWFIKYEGLGKTTLFFIVEVAYLSTFVIVRGVVGTYVVYKILGSDIFDLEEKLVSALFYVLSWLFMYDMYGYVKHKYEDRIPAAVNIKARRSTTDDSTTSEAPSAVPHLHAENLKRVSRRVQTLPWIQPKSAVLIKSFEPLNSVAANNFQTPSFAALANVPDI